MIMDRYLDKVCESDMPTLFRMILILLAFPLCILDIILLPFELVLWVIGG